MKFIRLGLALLLVFALAACSSVTQTQNSKAFPAQARWVLLPFVNNAQVPQAGQRAEAIAAALMRGQGVTVLGHYQSAANDAGDLPYLDDSKRLDKAMAWARGQGYQYGLSGTVTEWGYKTGLDGEPAVGVTMTVVDIASGQVLWSASGARSGWGFSTLSGTAQKLMDGLLSDLPLEHAK